MTTNATTIQISPKSANVSYDDFIVKLHAVGIFNDFNIAQISLPVYTFREEILEHIATNGLSSLFNFTIVQEDILSPSMHINQISTVVRKFTQNLSQCNKLVIIDPYFFAKSQNNDAATIFREILSDFSSNLKEIHFITNGLKEVAKNDVLSVIDSSINLVFTTTGEFHDRFWIDPENNKGIIMGTSLNGLGKKIALIDLLKSNDVEEILSLAKNSGINI